MSYLLDTHKLSYHIPTLNQYLYKDSFKTYPIYVEISPTGFCNHKCRFCGLDYYRTNVSLDTKLLKDTIDCMAKCKVKSLMFAGEGEPLLYQDLPGVITYAKRKYLDCAVATNGSVVSSRMLNVISKLTWIKFSVDGGDAKTYSHVHGCWERQFNIVWDNIRAVVGKQGNSTVGVQALVLPDNIKSLKHLAKLSYEAGVDYLVFKPYSQHKYSETKEYEHINYSKYLPELYNIEQNYAGTSFNIIIRTNSMKYWDSQARAYNKCYATPYLWAYIDSRANVWACSCFIGVDKFNLGNLHEHSFKDIWLGKKRAELIDYMQKGLDISECRVNCRMDKCNRYLNELHNPPKDWKFI